MLSREDRILSELIVSWGLATPETVERRAQQLEDSGEEGLVDAMVSRGELDPEPARRVRDEAREIHALLQADLPEGKTLGEFRLVREIGRGGMAIVYEAEQESLGRRVALKVLPAGAALDERLAIRFLREARTVARLSHPGIVPVYGTGRARGVLFFAMELIEGESLAERIDRGPFPFRDAARVASSVAHALEHAHQAGLVHRDVKPENVLLGVDGRARLTDFGLVHDAQGARLTRSHYVLGTPAYLAPEQARGGAVDPRSDVYGAGAVLYAMLAGRPPFAGEVAAAVLGRVMQGPPTPLAKLSPDVPPKLVDLCERAMAREPERRFASAGAFAAALDRFLAGSEGVEGVAGERTGRRILLPAALGILALIVGLSWLIDRGGGAERAELEGEPVSVPAPVFREFPTPDEPKAHVALSPDGKTVAYNARTGFRMIREGSVTPVRDVIPGSRFPAWSPSGDRIAYCRDRELEILDLPTDEVVSLGEPCGNMSWSPDGARIVHAFQSPPQTRLRVVDLDTGAGRVITRGGARYPSWSPDGSRIAFRALWSGIYDVWTVAPEGGDPVRVTDDEARELSPVWSTEPGRLYYGSDRSGSYEIWSRRIDLTTGEPISEPRPVTQGSIGERLFLSAARDREQLAIVSVQESANHWGITLGTRSEALTPPRRIRVQLPPDARSARRAPERDEWIVAAIAGEAVNLRRHGLDASAVERVTEGAFRDSSPRWSPDGSTIAFDSDRSGRRQIWTVRPDGTELRQVTRGESDTRSPVWSPDGRRLVGAMAGHGLRFTDVDASPGTEVVRPVFFEPSSWSRDGRRIAGTTEGIVVYEIESGELVRLTDYGEHPMWLGDRGELAFTHEGNVSVVSIQDRQARVLRPPGPNRLWSELSVAPDGRELSFTTSSSLSGVWLLEPRITE